MAAVVPRGAVYAQRGGLVADWGPSPLEARGFGPCLLCDRADDSFVGRGGLRWTEVAGERCIESTYALVSERWGQRPATEAARATVSWAQRLDLIELVARGRERRFPARYREGGLELLG